MSRSGTGAGGVVQYWVNAGFLEVDQMIEVAQVAESLGFAGITLPDHLFLPGRRRCARVDRWQRRARLASRRSQRCPGASRDADALDELGVEALMLPAVALAPSTTTADVIAGLERFADRRMR